MAINLVEAIMDHLNGPIINQLADVIGESPEKTRTATTGIVPALLSGLAGTASKPNGGNLISSLLDKVDDGMLDNLGALLSGPSAASVSQSGSNLLTSFFGDNLVTQLVSGITKFAGLGSGSARSLLACLASIVFGGIKRLMRGQGLDINGLVNLLLEQKDDIAKALPVGLASLLGSLGLLPGSAQKVQETAGHGEPIARRENGERKSSLRWLIPVLVLVVLGVLATRWLREEKPQGVAPPAGGPAYQAPTAPTGDVATQLTQVLGTASDILRGITNADSAEAALPKLRGLNTQLDQLRVTVNSAPQATRDMVASRVANAMPMLQAMINQALAIPGVEGIIRPAVEVMKEKLRVLGAP